MFLDRIGQREYYETIGLDKELLALEERGT